jgi:hypothetical protein
MNKKTLQKHSPFTWLFLVLLLAVLFFSGCPQNSYWEDIPLPPEMPQNIRVRPGNDRLIVSWDSAWGADSYELIWGEENKESGEEQSEETTATRGILNNLENEKVYWVRVRST